MVKRAVSRMVDLTARLARLLGVAWGLGLACTPLVDEKVRYRQMPSTFVAAPADLSAVEATSRAFDDAQFRKNVERLERLLASDMVFIRGSGARVDRSGVFERVQRSGDPL